MLTLSNSRTLTLEGVTVFSDHADPDQFWFLPGPVQLARRADGEAAFTFIKYKPAAVEGGAKGGGFLTFEANLRLDPDTERRILSRLSALTRGKPRLAVVPFQQGTVQCIALNVQGSGGTTTPPAGPGSFNAVEKILGASVPALDAGNTAAFSLTLSQEGAILLEQAFEKEATPVGVLYNLIYTGLRPALAVKITADFERIYNQFSASVEGQIYFLRGAIEAGLEWLVQNGAIRIEVTDFIGEKDRQEKEKWALDFFADKLLADWFRPTLTPGQVVGGLPDTGTSSPLPPAALKIESRTPDPSPTGYEIVHTPATSGTTETLRINGGANPPVVKVDGQVRTLDSSRQLTIEVAAGSQHEIVVEHAAVAAADETFDLKFLQGSPPEADWGTSPPSAGYLRYLANSPAPPDAPFSASQAPKGSPPGVQGADALRDWIQNRLATPREVTIRAHDSYENDDTPAKQLASQQASQRRLDVARGIIGSLAKINSASGAFGFTEAKAAKRSGDANDRVAKITGKANAGSPAVTIRGRITRAAQSSTQTQPKPPVQQPAAALAFKLRFIHQEERKTLTLEYHREEATQRTYAPQGFIGLFVRDLEDPGRHFLHVDLDDAFFRTFTVEMEAPIDFARIGLQSAHVALDYGPPDAPDHKHGDFVFERRDQKEKLAVFMNAQRDTEYRQSVQYHFDPGSGWEGRRFSYTLPAETAEDRTLLLNPYEHLGFLEVSVFPHQIDAEVVESADVHLAYAYPDSTLQEKVITVLPTSAPQSWKLRLEDPAAREYTYRLVHHLKDGTTREQDPVSSRATALAVNDPFPKALEIDFIPVWMEEPRMVFIDLEYNDPDNDYRRELRLTLPGNSSEPAHVRIALIDPKKQTFRYRQTIVFKDNRLKRGPFVETTETLIGVSD
jgi:hypothetical protein